MSAPLKVEEKILKRSIREVPEERTHWFQPSPVIDCRKDVVGLDYAEVKCTRDYKAQQVKTVVEEGLIQKALSQDEMLTRSRDPLLSASTQMGYRTAIREGTPLKEVMPYHKSRSVKVGESYTSTDVCVRYLDRRHLECLKDNVVPDTSPCEKVEVLMKCASDASFSPAVAATVVDVPHKEAKKCLLQMEQEEKVFKTEPQKAEPHLAVCAGERQFQSAVKPVGWVLRAPSLKPVAEE